MPEDIAIYHCQGRPFPKSMMHMHIPPISKKIINFTSLFVQFTFLCLIYIPSLPPYFDHDAFTHHAIYILDHCQECLWF